MRVTYTQNIQLFKEGFWAEFVWEDRNNLWRCTDSSSGFFNIYTDLSREITEQQMTVLMLASE